MARLLRRGSFTLAISVATSVALLAACHGPGGRGDGGADAAEASTDAGPDFDALPDTITIYLEAGVEPDGRIVRPKEEDVVPDMVGLPRPCQDRTLGTVTFVQSGAKVLVATSKGVASATCVRMDEHKLLCDWADKDGNATVTRKPVSYGPKTKIGGSYDGKHTFSCPAQTDPRPPSSTAPVPGTPRAGRKAGAR